MSKHNGGRARPPRLDPALAAMAQQAVPIQAPEDAPPTRDLDAVEPPPPHPFDGMKAVGYWVWAERVLAKKMTASGLIEIPEESRRPIWQVISVGDKVEGIKVGDIVLFGQNPPQIAIEGRTFCGCLHGDLPHHTVAAILDPNNVENRPTEKKPVPEKPLIVTS